MLCELSVKNLALIEKLSISFGPGANILTGETGAGKSILVGALGLVMGRKASADVVRAGAEEASVEALFNLKSGPEMEARFNEVGLEFSEDLILKRVVNSAGRSRAYANGALLTLAQLAAFGDSLLAISGQHDQQSLLRPANQLDFLDAFGRHQKLLAAMREAWNKKEAAESALRVLESELREAEEKRELYEFQRAEIEKVAPGEDEDERLWEERNRGRNSAKLAEFLDGARELLSREPGNVLEKMERARRNLEKAADLDETLGAAFESLEEALALAADAAQTLERFRDDEADPERIEWLDERLNSLAKLKRKFGPTLADVIARGKKLNELLDRLDGAAIDLAELRRGRDAAREAALKEAGRLSEARRKAAEKLAEVLSASLRPLGFPRLEMRIDLGEEGAADLLGPKGFDQVSFLFSPKPGEGLKPLAKIASGGELSRVMLALKTAQPDDADPAEQLLVFDEIDSGLGGGTAEAVAKRLGELSSKQQTVIITHLAQMAALPGRHFLVSKTVQDERTMAAINELSPTQRPAELARMLTGQPSAEALALARSLLKEEE